MFVGKVVGNVWATRKEESLTGLKFLVIEPGLEGTKVSNHPIVAVDRLGAGIDDMVMVTSGSTAANVSTTSPPIDARVVGIIDSIDMKDGNYM